MITYITTRLFDENGMLEINSLVDKNILPVLSRNSTSILALDSTLVIEDKGFTMANEKMTVVWKQREGDYELVKNMIKNHREVYVNSENGLYLCIFENVKNSAENITINFVIVAEMVD